MWHLTFGPKGRKKVEIVDIFAMLPLYLFGWMFPTSKCIFNRKRESKMFYRRKWICLNTDVVRVAAQKFLHTDTILAKLVQAFRFALD